jgi:hypothetical protein
MSIQLNEALFHSFLTFAGSYGLTKEKDISEKGHLHKNPELLRVSRHQ